MVNMINIYRANPTDANARKVRGYERSHAMAWILLTKEEADYLADIIRHANRT